MDISQYVKNDHIDEKIIADLLDAKCGTATIYAVTSSIFKEEKDIEGGFFARASNKIYLLAKKHECAKIFFDSAFNELTVKNYGFLKKQINKSYIYANFNMPSFPELSFDKNINKHTILRYGNKIRIGLTDFKMSLSDVTYDSSQKAICYSYEDYTTVYFPIVLD